MDDVKLANLRRLITENLRVQREGEPIDYINVGNAFADATAKQNHAIFARRGCGKTLLLHSSGRHLPEGVVPVYLNCEDFKQHSFPNVLIEILTSVFAQFDDNLTGWFGRGKKSREILSGIQQRLAKLRETADQVREQVRATSTSNASVTTAANLNLALDGQTAGVSGSRERSRGDEVERTFAIYKEKLQELDLWLPELKRSLVQFFQVSNKVKFIFLQVDDLYHLRRADQAFEY